MKNGEVKKTRTKKPGKLIAVKDRRNAAAGLFPVREEERMAGSPKPRQLLIIVTHRKNLSRLGVQNQKRRWRACVSAGRPVGEEIRRPRDMQSPKRQEEIEAQQWAADS